MAYTTINKHSSYFNTVTYVGNGSTTQTITGVGFKPDWSWIKNRSVSNNHNNYDVVRGQSKRLKNNTDEAEVDIGADFTFQSDGFYVGNRGDTNGNGNNIVAWNWLAGGSQGSSNTDGTINTTYTSVNTTSGFSICSWTGTGSAGTIGHGLNAVPKMIIAKRRSDTRNWPIYHHNMGNDKKMYLNDTQAQSSSTNWNSTTPTSSVFSIGSADDINGNGSTYVAYCFAEKPGYSKFGSYIGNASTDGTFVYTGFKPSFLIVKNTASSTDWIIIDNKRPGYDPNLPLQSNLNNAEGSSTTADLLSNGFKVRNQYGGFNGSGATHIYMAFGQSLVGSNNIPCTAR